MTENHLSLKVDLTPEEIETMKFNHAHWESSSEKFNTSHEVSWGDTNMMALEVENILNYIEDGSTILDVGCSNGYSTFKIGAAKDVRIKAFDYSEKAISNAKSIQKETSGTEHIDFSVGNALNIDHQDETFDAAYNIRVMINLPSWEAQQKGMLEVHRVLKKGGLYLCSEAFAGGLRNLNELRALAHLKPLTAHKFNLYLEEEKLEAFLEPYFEIVAIKKFSSIYYAASRFLRYLTMNPGDQDSFENEINNLFLKYKETENSGDFGIQKLYVLKKKQLTAQL